jgi:hypothetical protein
MVNTPHSFCFLEALTIQMSFKAGNKAASEVRKPSKEEL